MKTLNKLVYSIAEATSNFELNDDSPYSMLWIEDQIISQNHTLIRKAKTERRIDPMLYMTDDNIEVKLFDSTSVIPGMNPSYCKNYSYIDINPLLTGLKGSEVSFVANAAYSIIFKRSTILKVLRGRSEYYSLGKPMYAILDDKLIFRTSELAGLKYVSMSGIFNDPRLVSSWNPEDLFKTPSEKNLEILTIQHIGTALGMPMDLINDAQRAYQGAAPKEQSNE
jgi:hypothetical protein